MKKPIARNHKSLHRSFTIAITGMIHSHLSIAVMVSAVLFFLPGCTKNASFNELPVTRPSVQTASFPIPTVRCPLQNSSLIEANLINLGYTKTFEDEFNGNSLDISKWNAWESGAYNHELQLYQASNLTPVNGILEIHVRKPILGVVGPSVPGGSNKFFRFTSGRIESISTFSPNAGVGTVRIAARIKLPAEAGMWPAFWTLGDSWPNNGEIDIMEAKGPSSTQYQTNYVYGSGSTNQVTGAEKWLPLGGVNLTDCYHIYEMEWTATELKFYLDGSLLHTITASTSGAGQYISTLYTKLQHITVNLAVGGDFLGNPPASSIHPGTMYVDWVKVFTR